MSKLQLKNADRAASLAEERQVAAVPVRILNGVLEVCLVTTRQTRRWTVPKGWPMKNIKDHRAAAIEAEQEAGLVGRIVSKPLGTFLYWKRFEAHYMLVNVTAYRFDVTGQLPAWREQAEREVRWFPAAQAAMLVQESGLSALIEALPR